MMKNLFIIETSKKRKIKHLFKGYGVIYEEK